MPSTMIQLPGDPRADAESEQRRWVRTLAIPFIAASTFMAAALSGAGAWLMGAAILCGPRAAYDSATGRMTAKLRG